MFASNISLSSYLFNISLIGLVLLIIGMYYFLVSDKKGLLLFIPLILAFVNVILFVMIDGNIKEIDVSLK